MHLKDLIASGAVAAAITVGASFLTGPLATVALGVDYLATPQLWRSITPAWTYSMLGAGAVGGFVFGALFSVIHPSIPGDGTRRGLVYGLMIWLVGAMPGLLLTYATMAIPDNVIASWALGGLANVLIVGAILGRLYGRMEPVAAESQ